MPTQTDPTVAAIKELTLRLKIVASNCATKKELAILNGKIDLLTGRGDVTAGQTELALKRYIDLRLEQAFQARADMMCRTFATKADLTAAVSQLTWRMAAFGSVLLSAGFAFARYL